MEDSEHTLGEKDIRSTAGSQCSAVISLPGVFVAYSSNDAVEPDTCILSRSIEV
jgi:hypothetical protein